MALLGASRLRGDGLRGWGIRPPSIPHPTDRLFAPFQRLGDREPRGLGLGLSVARGFTEAMGGTLTAEDTPGGGLTMTVSLPAAARPAPAVAEPAGLAP